MTLRTCFLLGALGIFSPNLAGAATQAPDSETVQTTTRSARRILHLARGTVLTAVARQHEGVWQIKRRGEWADLPAGQVVRAPKEADVLREYKQRAKALDSTPEPRLALATWCAAEGLRKEALQATDRILDRNPHHAATLEFLGTCDFIAMPTLNVDPGARARAMEQIFNFAPQAPRSARERAIVELRKVEGQPELHARLLKDLADKKASRRAFSAQALGRLFPGKDSKRLLQHAVLDIDESVRRAAAEALGAANQPDLIAPVVRALGSKHPRIRYQASSALGHMGYPQAVKPLVNYIATAAAAGSNHKTASGYIFTGNQRAFIQDFDVEVATTQAVADPQINTLIQGSVLEAGVAGTTEYSFSTASQYARRSLARLTGHDQGKSGQGWANWWQKNGADWEKRTTITQGEAPE